MARCEHCINMKYEGTSWDNPYPLFWCGKGNWDAVPTKQDLSTEINCEDFKE